MPGAVILPVPGVLIEAETLPVPGVLTEAEALPGVFLPGVPVPESVSALIVLQYIQALITFSARRLPCRIQKHGFVLLNQLGHLLVRWLRLAEGRGEELVSFCTKSKP